MDKNGLMYFVDATMIRKVDQNGIISTLIKTNDLTAVRPLSCDSSMDVSQVVMTFLDYFALAHQARFSFLKSLNLLKLALLVIILWYQRGIIFVREQIFELVCSLLIYTMCDLLKSILMRTSLLKY